MQNLLIIEAECIDDGVLVTFDDGITALFTASFMSAQLSAAVEVVQSGPEAPQGYRKLRERLS